MKRLCFFALTALLIAALCACSSPAPAQEGSARLLIYCEDLAVPDYELTADISGCASVCDVLVRVCDDEGIDYRLTGSGSFAYLAELNGLAEFAAAPLAGWVCAVNGAYLSEGIGSAPVADGDTIEFFYTLDLGADVRAVLDAREKS